MRGVWSQALMSVWVSPLQLAGLSVAVIERGQLVGRAQV
jgi:hypothetical protein